MFKLQKLKTFRKLKMLEHTIFIILQQYVQTKKFFGPIFTGCGDLRRIKQISCEVRDLEDRLDKVVAFLTNAGFKVFFFNRFFN
mgnify:CR=1 FL=1